ncbi:MAG TPA: hypothetical protein VIW64_04835 [Pyrinomonadaceae bacterium]|jgi:hypothetical protein
MSRNVNRQSRPIAKETSDAINQYLTALHQFYPSARGETRVVVRNDHRVIVTAPLPGRARERMRLFDQMADVGTRLLIETDDYIILSSR